jgi:hypothetical protein
MAVQTLTVEKKEIKRAMKRIGLDDRAKDLLDILDKMELDRNLKISMEEADRGETISIEELKKETAKWLKNGFK